MSKRKEIIPSDKILQVATEAILLPTIEEVAKDAGKKIELDVFVLTADKEAIKLPRLQAGPSAGGSIPGTLRVRFRKAFGERTLMCAEAKFDRDFTISNCSGFR